MTIKASGFGVVFQFDPAGGTTWQTVPAINEIGPPDTTKETLDVTTHDSPGGWEELRREKIKRSEDMEITIVYDPTDAIHEALLVAVENDDDSVIPNCLFTYSAPEFSSKTIEFNALFLAFAPETPMSGDPVTAVLTIHPVGARTRL